MPMNIAAAASHRRQRRPGSQSQVGMSVPINSADAADGSSHRRERCHGTKNQQGKSMPINIAAAAAAAAAAAYSYPPQQRQCLSYPSWILLNNDSYTGSRPNNTTAVGEGRNNLTIEASIWLAPPPLPSNLFVHCPGATFPHASKILSTAEDLLLFRIPVAVGPPPRSINFAECDYMIYRAGGTPSLTLIPDPKPNFYDRDVGLLPRGDLFTVAALVAKSNESEYKLHRFDSEVGNWITKIVSLETPREPYPVKIPMNALRLNHHITTTVITLGGEAGTMGWVDLWSGILLCDLFHERPVLRHIRLPLPMEVKSPHQTVTQLGCPRSLRGIASVVKHGQPCLKLAALQILEKRLPYDDIEVDMPCYIVNDWAVMTWSNTKMGCSDSINDWQDAITVWASQIIISDTVRSELVSSGLLDRKPSEDSEETVELALQNLAVSEPTPSLNGEEDVVYLMARPKRFHPKAWSIAIDMKNCALLGVSQFGTDGIRVYPGVTYRSSTISKYMNPSIPAVTRKP